MALSDYTAPVASPDEYHPVCIRTGFPNSFITPSGSTNYAENNSWFDTFLSYETDKLIIGWANFTNSGNFDGITNKKELVAGSSAMTVRCGVSIGGVDYPFTINGNRDLVIQPDQVGAFDPLSIPLTSALTAVTFKYRIVYASIPTYWGRMINNQVPLVGKNEFGTGLSDRTLSPSWSSPPNTSSYVIMPPTFILGKTTNGKSIEIWGDSIGASGTGDTGYVPDLGFIQRASRDGYIPYITNGAGGRAMWQYTSADPDFLESRNRRRALAPILSRGGTGVVFIQMITNDFGWSRTATQCAGYAQDLAAQALARGQRPIIFTCPPRTNGSNNGKCSSDVASVQGWVVDYNTEVRSTNGWGYGYFDLAALWSSDIGGATPNINGMYWLTSCLGDGIHPNTAGMALARDALTAKLPTLLARWID